MRENEPLLFILPYRVPECRVHFDRRVLGFHLQLLTEGGLSLHYDDRSFLLNDGVWFWPTYPGPRVRFHAAPGFDYWSHWHIGFQGRRLERWQEEGLLLSEPQRAPGDGNWATRFGELMSLANRDDYFGRRRATLALETILVELAESRRSETSVHSSLWLEQVIAALEASGFAPDYDRVAHASGVSISSLRRRFKQETGGVGLHEYVILRRIGRAKSLLEETDLSLQEIAGRVGYESAYFFFRQFRQHSGLTPGEYRRNAR